MKFVRVSQNPIFNCENPGGITTLRLGFSHLREHKFRHYFQDTLNLFCSCRDNMETTTHNLLHCPNYLYERMTLLNNLQNVEENILDRNYSRLSEILLFGDSSFNDWKNTNILNATIQYIFDTRRSEVPLTNLWKSQKFENSFTVLSPLWIKVI